MAQPRVLTELTVASYVTMFGLMCILWPKLVPYLVQGSFHTFEVIVYLSPAVLLTMGAFGGAIEAYRGNAKYERVALASALTGLWGGVLFEAAPILGSDFAGVLLIAMALVITFAVLARMNYLSHKQYAL